MGYHDDFDNAGRDATDGDVAGGHRGPVPGKYDRIRIPEAPLKVYLRLIPGAYHVTEWEEAGKPEVLLKPYFKSRRHVLQPTKADERWAFLTCPRGLNLFEDPQKCPLCNFLDGREAETSTFLAHTALGLWNYHIVERAPKPGTNQKRTYKNLVVCEVTATNPNCKLCASSYPWQLGYLGHFDTNLSDYDELKRLNSEMGAHCQCGGTIIAHQASCPTCHTVLASVESGLSDSEFQRFLVNKQVCPTCRVLTRVVPIRRCTNCAEPRPLSIYDANIWLWREKTGRGDYKALKGEIESWGPLDPQYGNIEPLDLEAIYAPEPIGRLSRRVPGYRNKMRENPQDQNAVPRNPMEAAAAAAQAAGRVNSPPLPPGVFGGQKPAVPAPAAGAPNPSGPPMPPGSFAHAGAKKGPLSPPKGQQMALPAMPPGMGAAPATRQAAPKPPPALEEPPELPPELGDLSVDDDMRDEG